MCPEIEGRVGGVEGRALEDPTARLAFHASCFTVGGAQQAVLVGHVSDIGSAASVLKRGDIADRGKDRASSAPAVLLPESRGNAPAGPPTGRVGERSREGGIYESMKTGLLGLFGLLGQRRRNDTYENRNRPA
jgi:hypothetical protein